MKRHDKRSDPGCHGDLKQIVSITTDVAERQKAAPEIAELLANEQAARRETEIVRDANIALTQDLSLNKVLDTLLDYLHKLVPYDSANVMLLEGESKFVVSALRNYDSLQDMEPLRTLTLDVSAYQSLQRICTTRRSVVLADTSVDSGWEHITGAEHIRNWLGVPLVAYGKVIGLYSLDKIEPGFFTKEHVRIAETLAAPAASAIQNARLFQQTQRYAADLEKRISDTKEAEAALRASEERYRELFENARDAVYVHDLNGIYLSVNRAAEKLTGYPREEIIGKHFSEFVEPSQVERLQKWLCRKLIVKGGTSYEVDLVIRDGLRAPVEVSSNLIYDQGVPVGVQGLVRDITERRNAEKAVREAERKYRQIFENAGEGIFQSTPGGQFIAANPEMARIHGFDSPAELIQSRKDISRQIYADPARRKEFKRLIEEHGVVRGFEHQVFRKDGSKIWVTVNARAVRDERGKVIYYEGTTQDITERKLAEQALRSFSRLLIKAQEAERQSIARELHDQIGQVLTAVRINLQTTQEACKPSEKNSLIAESITTVDEALAQVRDLSFELRPSLLDDLGLVTALRQYAAHHAQRTGLCTKTAIEFPEGVRLDRELETACFRIVQEALTNVARHAGARNVSLSLKRLNGEFLLTIKDDGVGFDAENVNAHTFPINLGLRGMEERSLALGGRLEIKSAPSRGTEICAYFPHAD